MHSCVVHALQQLMYDAQRAKTMFASTFRERHERAICANIDACRTEPEQASACGQRTQLDVQSASCLSQALKRLRAEHQHDFETKASKM